ncbi:hypothetical protein S40293_04475 [Stachybotrys chartarum IBT 40293]|nr:hypothetical protein S40293_04475 [Stachybotrys chartarum IBT 40293]
MESGDGSTPRTRVSDRKRWSRLLHAHHRPLLTHLNGDTTWLVQLPYPASHAPPPGRTHFNLLVDPWLQGPQSDVAWWFSTQWHVVEPSVATIADLNAALREVEGRGATAAGDVASWVDAVVVSHEFTDHCHRATLEELPRGTPVFATEVAAQLIRGWNHFDKVLSIPGLAPGVSWTKLPVGPLPDWLGVGTVVTAGDALYYHSAIIIAFDINHSPSSPSPSPGEAIIYSPHGIQATDLASIPSCGVTTTALLHGLHDVRIWRTKQLNLGALNGVRAALACGAKYWIATHDEVKMGGGFIAPLLQRVQYSLSEAEKHERDVLRKEGEKEPDYLFCTMGSGDGMVLITNLWDSEDSEDSS